jgi:hypothetical protein
MTKQEVIALIYQKKEQGLEFTEAEKTHIFKYYSEDQVNCMNINTIDLDCCVRRKVEFKEEIGGLI